ncbi:MAG: hypothetical protein KF872_05930 [Chitinophagales bacterium]|nr:hypothetical protein [Chitinophagales bacterium]
MSATQTIVVDTVMYGLTSVGVSATPAVTSSDPLVQIVSIVCTMLVAVANITFGYLMLKSKRNKN